jgi:hypothetical protein
MGFWSALGGFFKKAAPLASIIPGIGPIASALTSFGADAAGDIMQTAGRGAGAVAETQAKNRGAELDAMMEADQQAMLANRVRREDEDSMWKKLQAINYMKGGGMQNRGPSVGAGGKSFTKFNFGAQPVSDADKQMATTLEGQLMQRLNNPPQLRNYDAMMKPGTAEKVTGWGAPILSTLGSIFKNKPAATPTTAPTPPPADPIGLNGTFSFGKPAQKPIWE